MKLRLIAALLLAAAVLVPGCSPTAEGPAAGPGLKTGGAVGDAEPPSEPGKYGGRIIDSSISDPKTFNVIVANETSSTEPLSLMYEGLITRNEYTLKFEERLAERHTMSEDGLTHTYTLREGLKWSDGQPITADDVIFTLDVIFDPRTESSYPDVMKVDVDMPDGSTQRVPFKYRKIDARSVEFVLPTKWAPWENSFSFPILPRHKLEAPFRAGKFNSTWGVNTSPAEFVGSGAFLISEYVPRQRIVFKRNPNYFKKSDDGTQQLPYLDQWFTLTVPDQNTDTLKFRNGDTDILTTIKHSDYPGLKRGEQQGNYTVINRGPGWGFNFLSFNLNPDSAADQHLIRLFQDVRFRRAASHAIDRSRMVEDIFQGMAQPSYSPVSPANKLFYNPNVPRFEYDLDKARALLAEIGLKDSNGNGILEYNGKDVRFNILTNTENEQRKAMATIISEDLRKVGLGAQFTPITFNDLVRRMDSPPYDWEAEIDKIFKEGAREMDPVKRKAIYDRWQVIAAEQQPFIYLITAEGLSAVRNRFGNIKPSSLTLPFKWNAEEIFDRSATRLTP